jgi:hypothetical protein
MVALSGNRIAWTYTDSDGVDWRVAAQKALTDQNKLGGEAAALSVPPKPPSIKMRRITVHAVGVGSRVLPVYSVGAPIATKGETINANFLGTSTEFTSQGNVIEQKHVIHNVTSQAT